MKVKSALIKDCINLIYKLYIYVVNITFKQMNTKILMVYNFLYYTIM